MGWNWSSWRGEASVAESSVNWLQLCEDEPHPFIHSAGKYEQLTSSCVWMDCGVLERYTRDYTACVYVLLNIGEADHSCQH